MVSDSNDKIQDIDNISRKSDDLSMNYIDNEIEYKIIHEGEISNENMLEDSENLLESEGLLKDSENLEDSEDIFEHE
ncbi:10405_t:CDS:2, partial [Funneliformis geosporum]